MSDKFSIIDLLWLFFIFSALQPLLRQKMLEGARVRLITQLEKKRGSRVITLIHREETMSLLGFPIFKYIDINDSEQILRAIRLTPPEMPIDFILHTPGGLVLASLQIAFALRKHPGKVTVFIPHYAMSGGTFIALAADEIIMDSQAVLGPVDPQLGEYPAVSILNAVKQKDKNEIDDRTLILADIATKAMAQLETALFEILRDRLPENKAKEIARILSSGKWTHDHPITFEEASSFGLSVNEDMPEEIYQLMDLYPQPVRHHPSVEYIPLPYKPRGKPKS